MSAQLAFELDSGPWIPARDGDDTVRAVFDRHYSRITYLDGRRPRKFVGPGQYMALRTAAADAIFIWRLETYRQDGQRGVNCMVFRNDGPLLSSELIRAADELAWNRWPGRRHFTFVAPRQVKSPNPGFCFIKAGWRRCGRSAKGLHILERIPH